MAQESQWLSSRSSFSDWTTDRRTEAGSKVSLQYQHENISSHPLPMGVQRYCIGLFPLGITPITRRSFFYGGDALLQNLFDYLATESFAPIVTEDTNERLGLG